MLEKGTSVSISWAVVSLPLRSHNRGEASRKDFCFCEHACNFLLLKISKGGEGGREARKEIKTHFCLVVKEARGKISISKAAKIPAAAFPQKDVLNSSTHGAQWLK